MHIIKKLISLFSKKGRPPIDTEYGMKNVVDSIFNSSTLYDELKVKCHPDLFVDAEAKQQALELFQHLQEIRYDINKMTNLKPKIDLFYNREFNNKH